MFQYPYGDSQQLNLDWLMEQWQETKASIDGSLQGEIDRVEAAITDLLTARDQAVAAQTAAETAATSASGYASTASGAASTATAQATAAAASAALAGNHASNAQTSETNAGLQATAAGNSASAAATSATNARNSELAAAASSSAAAGNALYAEGMAKGTQNGTPVTSGSPYYENNAAYWAGEAQSYANDSEAMAKGTMNGTPVSSGDPGYEDNAKYYKDQAAAQAAAAAASAASADGAAAQTMIAPLEASSTASAAHAAGTYFRLNGVLYMATQDIAVGATITPGTNCSVAVLGNDVSELKTALTQVEISKISKNAIQNVPLTWTSGKYINKSGVLTSGNDYMYATEEYYPVKSGIAVFVSANCSSNYCICLYDTEKKFVSYHNANGEQRLTPIKDGYIRLTNNTNNQSLAECYLILATNPQSETLNNIAKQIYADSGYCDFNFINSETIHSGMRIKTANGLLERATNYSATNFIPVIPNSVYKFNRSNTSLTEVVGLYNASFEFISAIEVPNNTQYITIPDNQNIAYIRISVSYFPESPTLKLVGKGEKIYHVTPTEGLLVGVKNAYSAMANKIIVEDGTYDVISEYETYYGNDYFTNYADDYNGRANGSWDYGIWLYNINVVFSPGAKVFAEYTGNNSYVTQYFSAFAIGQNVTIDGLNLEAKNIRYGLHPDFWTSGFESKIMNLTIRNCQLHNLKENDNGIDNNCAIGAGLPKFGSWLIENCVIKSDTSNRVIRIHNNADENACSNLTIRNCYIDGNGHIEVNSYGTSTAISNAIITGCSYANAPTSVIEGSGTQVNVAIIDFNNELRT